MTERAQALEAATAQFVEAYRFALRSSEGDERPAILAMKVAYKEAEAALAVQPPPPVGSPTTENIRKFTVFICDDCLNLRGEMCHEPYCRFCRCTMAEVAEYLNVLSIRPIIDGVGVIVDHGEQL